MDWFLALGFFFIGAFLATMYWAFRITKIDEDTNWQKSENAFKEELLNYHRDNLIALDLRNALTDELIKAVKELKK